MKREWRVSGIFPGFVALALVLALIGCGRREDTVDLAAVSNGAVSGEAAQTTDTEEDENQDWYANDDNVYSYGEGGALDEDDLIQMKPDGTIVRKWEIKDFYRLCKVTDQWIYYIVYREDDMDEDNCRLSEVWRMPIEKKEDGDHPHPEKKELLLSGYHISESIYVSDSCIIYLEGDDGEEELVTMYHYDLQTKQSEPWMDGKRFEEADFVWRQSETHGLLVFQGQLLFYTEDSIYLIEIDSGKWKQIYYGAKDLELFDNMIERCGQDIYFISDDDQIYRYCSGDERAELFLSKEGIMSKLEKICLWGEKGWDGEGFINSIMIYKGRMYLNVGVSWKQKMRLYKDVDGKDRGKMADWECWRTILLSAPVSSPAELTHESAVADYFKKHCKYADSMKTGGNEHIEDSRISFAVLKNGEVLLMINGSRAYFDSRSYAAYDPVTKKIRKVKRKEAETE